MKRSLIPQLLNSGIGKFWQETYPAMLATLGFNDKAAGFMLAAAVKETQLYTQHSAPLPVLRLTSREAGIRPDEKGERGMEAVRRLLNRTA